MTAMSAMDVAIVVTPALRNPPTPWMGGVAPGVALSDTPHEYPVAVVGNTFPFATNFLLLLREVREWLLDRPAEVGRELTRGAFSFSKSEHMPLIKCYSRTRARTLPPPVR